MRYASRLSTSDNLNEARKAIVARKGRSTLSGLGVALGIAALVAVVGISSSSRASLLAELDRLGSNLLVVAPGQTLAGDLAPLPDTAIEMIRRVPPVTAATAIGALPGITVRRTDRIPQFASGGIGVMAVRLDLLGAVGGQVEVGTFLNVATESYPAVVLGSTAAAHLGVDRLDRPTQVWLGDRYFAVIGVLRPLPLTPGLDRTALIGWPIAERLFGFDGAPSQIFVRAYPQQVTVVQSVLARTVNPQFPSEVQVSRPSDALAARAATDRALTTLLLALGSVSLLVGAVGVANVMFVAVLERRSEIGLRRAMGATRRHVAVQFITEAAIICALGGTAGILGGYTLTLAVAIAQGWTPDVPAQVALGGLALSCAIGVLSGIYPAMRAVQIGPADALRSL